MNESGPTQIMAWVFINIDLSAVSTFKKGTDWGFADRGQGHHPPEWGFTCRTGLTGRPYHNNHQKFKRLPVSQCVVLKNQIRSSRYVTLTCWCVGGWRTTYTGRPVLRNDPRRVPARSHGMCDQLSGQLSSPTFQPDTSRGFPWLTSLLTLGRSRSWLASSNSSSKLRS